ncbi:hypothetical protein CK203_064403 [Vitis vinifera]|uniref:Uncharacterized protein n=1 Tax=Vitis vinifera TaxID=29760 RepID=A0A438G4A2_VITVI|nr:hypothetical protein CK203_064403 [Vitis vinifera]
MDGCATSTKIDAAGSSPPYRRLSETVVGDGTWAMVVVVIACKTRFTLVNDPDKHIRIAHVGYPDVLWSGRFNGSCPDVYALLSSQSPIARVKFVLQFLEDGIKDYRNSHPTYIKGYMLFLQLVNQEQMPPESHSQQHATTFAHGHEAVEVIEARVIETAEHIMALAFALACNVVTLRSRNFVNPRSHTSPY